VVKLYDNLGKLVKTLNIPAQQQHYILGLKDVKAGMYVIKVDCNGKNIESKKFNIVR